MDYLPKVLNWLPKLGWPATMLALWGMLGLAGHSLLGVAWRAAQVGEFQRSVLAVAQLASSQSWQTPWESDPDWHALEKQLDIDLVPLTENLSVDTTWVRTPAGLWRASVTVPLDGSTTVKAIRGTRTYTDHGIDVAWWSAWTLLCGLVYSATWIVISRGQKRLKLEREDLALWRKSSSSEDKLVQAQGQLRQFQAILANLHEGILAVDHNGRVLLVNRVLIEQLGLSPQDEYYGRKMLEAVRVPGVVELVEHTLRTGHPSQQTIEVGNTPRYLQLQVSPQSIDQAPNGVLLTATDVSSSQRSELARREFVTGASHELKTPLAAIRAYTETLQSMHSEDPEMADRFLQNILDQADRMDRLVSGMLQLARAESGALKLKVQRIDAVMTLKPCIEAAQGMARAKGIEFIARMPAERTLVLADRDALQTIASNLLSNAIRYTPGGGRVEIELQTASAQNRIPGQNSSTLTAGAGPSSGVCLVVSDTGIGIPETEQSRIFERFYRVQKDRSLDSGGTGLGLAIVKQLVNVLEGHIELVSGPGQGTRFEIALPAVGFTQSSSNVGG